MLLEYLWSTSILRLTCSRARRKGRELQAKSAERSSRAVNDGRVVAAEVMNDAHELGTRDHFEWALVALARVALAGDDRTGPVVLVLVHQTDLGLLVISKGGGKVQLYLLSVLNLKLK